MNVKLTEVVDDITGATGMLILKAIVRGQRDPATLAQYRHVQCKSTRQEIEAALHGNWREEHLFALRQALKTYEHLRRQLKEADGCIEKYLKERPDRSAGRELPEPKKRRTPKLADPDFDARSLLFRWSGKDLTVIEGIGGATALTVLSEIGLDMSKWPTEKHFSSWLGLSPQHRGSGRRLKNRRIRGGANRAALALRMAAQGCHNAKNAMGAYYRRIQARGGGRKAVTATAHKIACRVYRLLKYGEAYVRQEMAAYEAMFRRKQTQSLARKATELGYLLIPMEEPAAERLHAK
jgi:transposase